MEKITRYKHMQMSRAGLLVWSCPHLITVCFLRANCTYLALGVNSIFLHVPHSKIAEPVPKHKRGISAPRNDKKEVSLII